jgi:MFS superfamily sulfate permease-like transporter
MRPFNRAGALRDARAGVALAAMNIPQVLGYTRIAGMPVVTGLYTLLLPLLAFAAFGCSRYLVVAADSATAAILASGLAGMAPVASAQYVLLAGYVALLTAAFLLLGRLFKLGFIADFLSQTVLMGFLTGVGFQVGIAVLGPTIGVEVQSRRTVMQAIEICRGLPGVHLPTLLVSTAVLAVVLGLSYAAPKIPGPLVAVVGATAASAYWHLSARGVATIGAIAGGLPHLHFALLPWREILPLIPVAASCAVMIVTQSAATARVYAVRHHEELNENRDLLGLAAANAAAAVSGTFVVNGSPTQTAMVESVGGQSQVAQAATACVVACVLLFLTRPLEFLPQCVLGALVLLVAIHLIDLRGLVGIRRESPGEFAVALTTAIVVVAAGVEDGILAAMVISLLRIVHHSYHPYTGVIIADAKKTWKVIPPVHGAATEPGLVLYHFGASLFYANAGRFAEEIVVLAGQPPSGVRWVIVDAEAIANVDYSAARVVLELKEHLDQMGVRLGFARLAPSTKADFDRHFLSEAFGPDQIFDRLHDALEAFGRESARAAASPAPAGGNEPV